VNWDSLPPYGLFTGEFTVIGIISSTDLYADLNKQVQTCLPYRSTTQDLYTLFITLTY